jgi:hypothetical protein
VRERATRVGSGYQRWERLQEDARNGAVWQKRLLAEVGRVRIRCGDKPLSNNAKYKEQSRETAMCVEMALNTVEDDIRSELKTTGGQAADALKRILEKLGERRKVLVKFTAAA